MIRMYTSAKNLASSSRYPGRHINGKNCSMEIVHPPDTFCHRSLNLTGKPNSKHCIDQYRIGLPGLIIGNNGITILCIDLILQTKRICLFCLHKRNTDSRRYILLTKQSCNCNSICAVIAGSADNQNICCIISKPCKLFYKSVCCLLHQNDFRNVKMLRRIPVKIFHFPIGYKILH